MGINLNESDQTHDHFLCDIEFVQGHYQVGLPWKRDTTDVHNHFNLSFNCLKLLQSRLLKEPELLKEYDRVISEQLANGIIELVDQSTTSPTTFCNCKSLVHYLPHHAVVRQDRETTKIWIAYDGSARDKDESHSISGYFRICRYPPFSQVQLAEPTQVSLIQDSLYIDDLVTGANTVDEPFKIFKVARRLMTDAGMNLRKWKSNSSELRKLIQADDGRVSNDATDIKSPVTEEEESYANS